MYYEKYYVNLNDYLVIKFENCLDQLSSIDRIMNKKNGWLNWDLVAQDMPLSQELSDRMDDLQISAQCSFVVCPNMIFLSSPFELKKSSFRQGMTNHK